MTLREFVEKFVYHNTLIRLWKPIKGGHKMLEKAGDSVCMEWELLRDETWQSVYNDCKVIGVTDILVDGNCSEAVNIVLDI